MKQGRDIAYEYLYSQIITYKMKPGNSIIESEIAATLNISRTPVREALNQLESEGMVCRYAGKGCFVADITENDVREICFLRRDLELAALGISCRLISKEDLRDMRTTLERLGEDVTSEEYYRADCGFHALLVESCQNKRLIRFIRTLNIQVERLRRVAVYNMDRPKKSKQEHLAIIDALLNEDYDRAKTLLDEHLALVEENIITICLKFF